MKRVPPSEFRGTPLVWTRGVAARETLRYLERNAIDAGPLLAKAGLSRGQLSQHRGNVSATSEYQFLEFAAREMNDPLLGLHIAAEMDMRRAGILFYLAASSRTVLEALENLARYAGTATEAVRVEVSRRQDETVMTIHPARAQDDPPVQVAEFIALGLIRMLRLLTNRDIAPSRVSFMHTRPSGVREVQRIMRCPVAFSQATDGWAFPQAVVELPIISADSHLLELLTAHADDLLAERRSVTGLQSMVENQLLRLLPGGRAQAATVAQQLGLSARSFTRYLAEEGTTYSEILDRLRNRLALRYLADERISLQQIAWLLGYSELSAFNHAFKRWFGMSPGKARTHPPLLTGRP